MSSVARGQSGAWQSFERGELDLFQFYKAFQEDLSDTANGNVWYADYCRKKGIPCPALPVTLDIDGRELFGRMMREAQQLDERFVEAINKIKASGRYKVIALTNNYGKALRHVPQSELEFLGCQDGVVPAHLRALFDDFCDSSEMGVR
jgi:hypothetical protein